MHEKGNNPHWHGLKKEDLLDITNQLESPAIIMQSRSDKDSIILVAENVDSDKLPIIISIKPNGRGVYNLEKIDANYLTSIYGKNNFANFLKNNIEENQILFAQKNKIQNLELFSKLQLFKAFPNGFEFNKILHQTISTVNSNEEEKAAFDEKDYWMVEFNETDEHIASYKGKIVTKGLNKILYLNKEKIQSLDSSSSLQLASNLSTFEFNKILHQTISTVNSNEEEKAAFDEKDYWMVEFNETDEHIASYKGKIVTKGLIDEIKKVI